ARRCQGRDWKWTRVFLTWKYDKSVPCYCLLGGRLTRHCVSARRPVLTEWRASPATPRRHHGTEGFASLTSTTPTCPRANAQGSTSGRASVLPTVSRRPVT